MNAGDHPDIVRLCHAPPIIDQDGNTIRQYAPWLDDKRLNRGLNHDVCGGLLCPIELDWSDSDVRASLRGTSSNAANHATQLDLNVSFFCRVFFEHFVGDEGQVNKGFLMSCLLIICYKAVFTGPDSAKDDEEPASKKAKGNSTRPPVCEILNMGGKVTARSIAYIAVLTHMALTDMWQISREYCGFSYPQMYNFLVDYFETPPAGSAQKKHVDDLLTWWTKQIFPVHSSTTASSKTAAASMAKLYTQSNA
ncbi:hypothetical protein B0H14DRAFT_3517070 [Mycena olivaceomarginata]|nr:hypothetical protein B0H14DRAFT_3517070 [Mycena olivaceomarginata]